MDVVSRAPWSESRAYCDLAYFARTCVPEYVRDEVPKFHKAIWQVMSDKGIPRAFIIAPRKHSKSTCVWCYILHRIAFNPRGVSDYVLFVSESGDVAKSYLDNIKNIVEYGVEFRRHFPWAAGQGPRWGKEDIVTNSGVMVSAIGTRQKIRGRNFHGVPPNVLILDDFESSEMYASDTEGPRVQAWYASAGKYALAPNGRIIFIGTVPHERSLLNRVRKLKSWKGLFLRAKYQEGDAFDWLYGSDGMLWGKPHANERGDLVSYNQAWWDAARSEAEDEGHLDQFYREIQNQIRAASCPFKVENFRTYADLKHEAGRVLVRPKGEDEQYRPVTCYLGVDPSMQTHARADWCVLMPVGVDADKNIYQLPYTRRRFGMDARVIVDAIFDMHELYGFRKVAVETTGGQLYLMGEIKRQMEVRDVWFSVLPRDPKKGKEHKAFSLQPLIDAGKLIFHPTANEELFHELAYFGSAEHDDTVDGLWLAREAAHAGFSEDYKPDEGVMDHWWRRSRDPVWNWKTEGWEAA